MKKVIIGTFVLLFSIAMAYGLPFKVFKGKPEVKPGEALGVFVFHNNKGIHLCTTTMGKAHVFTGTIRASKKIPVFFKQKLEKLDFVKRINLKKIKFSFKTKGNVDCVQFRAKGNVIFEVFMDGKKLPVSHIFIGKNMVHPKKNPFLMKRKVLLKKHK